jgi:hypothetical protein
MADEPKIDDLALELSSALLDMMNETDSLAEAITLLAQERIISLKTREALISKLDQFRVERRKTLQSTKGLIQAIAARRRE